MLTYKHNTTHTTFIDTMDNSTSCIHCCCHSAHIHTGHCQLKLLYDLFSMASKQRSYTQTSCACAKSSSQGTIQTRQCRFRAAKGNLRSQAYHDMLLTKSLIKPTNNKEENFCLPLQHLIQLLTIWCSPHGLKRLPTKWL